MSQDVGLGEEVGLAAAITARVHPRTKINVDLLIGGAIKGPGRGLGRSAAGVGAVAEEHQLPRR